LDKEKKMKINGMEVVDATKPEYIHITDRDVKSGGVKDPSGCAAAKACVRDLKVVEAKVHLGRIYMREGNKWVRYLTPSSLRTEIISFDRGGGFESGDYKLLPPPPSMHLGYNKPTGPKKRKVPSKRAPRHVVVGVRPAASRGDAK
jgi:hypothetical protein